MNKMTNGESLVIVNEIKSLQNEYSMMASTGTLSPFEAIVKLDEIAISFKKLDIPMKTPTSAVIDTETKMLSIRYSDNYNENRSLCTEGAFCNED